MTVARPIASRAAIVVGVAVSLAASTASADPAAAEALFREGRQLLDEGKIDEACLKLAESQAQDPSSGTLLNLGLCHETQHKLATAWSDYVSAGRLAREQGRLDRIAVADKKATALEPRLPHLTVNVAKPVAGLQITRASERLGLGVLGSAVPLDPGTYVIVASAPSHRSWKTTIDVRESESKTVEVPALEPEASPPPADLQISPAPPIAPVPEAPSPAPPSASRGMLGWVIGGAGVAAIGVGAGFGLASLAKYKDANTQCPSHTNCSNEAMAARNSAESKAWITNVAVGVGMVGVGIGAVILLSRPQETSVTRVVVGGTPEAGGMGVSLERSF